jgi:hypothetical protein
VTPDLFVLWKRVKLAPGLVQASLSEVHMTYCIAAENVLRYEHNE